MNEGDRFKKASSLFYADCFSDSLNLSHHEEAESLEREQEEQCPSYNPATLWRGCELCLALTSCSRRCKERLSGCQEKDGSEPYSKPCASQASPPGAGNGIKSTRDFQGPAGTSRLVETSVGVRTVFQQKLFGRECFIEAPNLKVLLEDKSRLGSTNKFPSGIHWTDTLKLRSTYWSVTWGCLDLSFKSVLNLPANFKSAFTLPTIYLQENEDMLSETSFF